MTLSYNPKAARELSEGREHLERRGDATGLALTQAARSAVCRRLKPPRLVDTSRLTTIVRFPARRMCGCVR
jgi:hypothetical protein